MEFRVSSNAQRLLSHVFGADAVSDKKLDARELSQVQNVADILEAVGVSPGGEITKSHGQMLLARAVVMGAVKDPGDRTQRFLNPKKLLPAADQFEAAADVLLAAGKPEAAFTALTSAMALRTKAASLAGSGRARRSQLADLEKKTEALAAKLIDLVAMTPQGSTDTAPRLDHLAQLGWTKAEIARLVQFGVAADTSLHEATDFVHRAIDVVDLLEPAGLAGREEFLMLLSRADRLLAATDQRRGPLLACRLLKLQATTLASAGITDPEQARRVLANADAVYSQGKVSELTEELVLELVIALDRAGIRDLEAITNLTDNLPPGRYQQRREAAQVAIHLLEAGVHDSAAVLAVTRAVKSADVGGVNASEEAAFAAALYQAGVTDPAAITGHLKSFEAGSYGSRDDRMSFATIAIRDGKMDPESAIQKADEFVEWGGEWHASTSVESFREMIGWGLTADQAITFLHDICDRNPELERNEVLDTLNVIEDLCNEQGIEQQTELRTIMHFLVDYGVDGQGNENVEDLARALVTLNVDLRKCNSREFGQAFSEAINSQVATKGYDDAGLHSTLCTLINTVHDGDHHHNHNDRIRDAIALHLSPEAAYALIAAGADSLYSSSYNKILAGMRRKVPDAELSAFLRRADPDQTATLRFLESLEGFSETGVINAAGDLFLPVVIARLDNSEEPLEDTSRSAAFILRTFPTMPPQQRAEIEAKIVGRLEDDALSLGERASMAFLLKNLVLKGAPLSAEALALANGLPEIPSVQPDIDAWLADGVITAKLFTRSDNHPIPKGWLWSKFAYFGGQGFKPDWTYMRANGMDGQSTVAMTRVQNGVKQRIIATYDESDDASQVDESIDIAVNRTHSYDLDEVFPTSGEPPQWNHRMLLIGGSCWSFRDMTYDDFLQHYGEHQVMAQTEIAGSWTNNRVLNQIFKGIAQGKRNWSQYGLRGYMSGGDGLGYRTPDHPSLTLGSYVKPFAQWLEARPDPAE